jgi:hypothetical protein
MYGSVSVCQGSHDVCSDQVGGIAVAWAWMLQPNSQARMVWSLGLGRWDRCGHGCYGPIIQRRLLSKIALTPRQAKGASGKSLHVACILQRFQ